jgi:A/G-specific adenine glycosylase
MQCWSGLGYYSRARNLHAAAKRVVDVFDGRFPDTVAALETLPGVGRSTAGAIAAFAFGRKAAILDGNVKRVFARAFLLEGPPASHAFTQRAWDIAEALLPDRDIERYTQGLMDLGATICTPRKPSCLICPFETTCLAHREGREETLPQRAVRKAIPRRQATLAVFVHGDDVLLERRPPVGIWGGLWSLPEIDRDALMTTAARFGTVVAIDDVQGFVHGFTHFVLDASVVRVTLASIVRDSLQSPPDTTRWVAGAALDGLGLPAPIRTLLATMFSRT